MAVMYIVVQFGGAVAAAGVLRALFGNLGGLGTTIPTSEATQALGLEILMTFILMTTVLCTSEKSRVLGPQSALAVGATFGALLILGWNVSGASVNPWRTLGPAIVSNSGWPTIWVYLIGPLIGGILAVIMQRFITPIRDLAAEDAAQGDGGDAGDSADFSDSEHPDV